jgi:D-arabinose 1-dehydrogenase-like Zn-dependent alcohol dehydrogenase
VALCAPRECIRLISGILAGIKGREIRPIGETAPLEQAADAYPRMVQGKARFRMVLTPAQ